MRDLSLIRRVEPLLIVGLATIYVIRRLVVEVRHIDDMLLSAGDNRALYNTFWDDLSPYNHTLNNNIPLIVGVCLFLAAWYVFHNLAFPFINTRSGNPNTWPYMGLTVLLLLVSVFVYHYLKLHVRYRHDSAGQIIGLKVYSLYRKRTVLADAIGLGILLCVYEICFGYYTFLVGKIRQESLRHFGVASYLLSGGLILLLGTFALNVRLAPTLWQDPFKDILLILGLCVEIAFLQEYFFRNILPAIQQPYSARLNEAVALFVLATMLTTVVIWGANTYFHYYHIDPILFFSGLVLVCSVGIAYTRQILNKEKTVLQTQVSATSAELSSLRAQINPHFLFNALNSLYATALKENSEKTADGIQKLGDMMRFMLQENNRDRIPLDKEVDYLHNYIQIQRMRIDETHPIEIRVNIQQPDREIYIAPMMLTPFVENAFKHGISFRTPSWIYITLTLDATRLYFKVHNTRHTQNRSDPEEAHSGVGLENVRKRLELIYPGRHTLDIQQSDQDYFVALTLVYW